MPFWNKDVEQYEAEPIVRSATTTEEELVANIREERFRVAQLNELDRIGDLLDKVQFLEHELVLYVP